MTELPWLAAFLVGVGGSVHCVGMCGGIVTAFSYAIPANAPHWPYMWAYNLGRIASYSIAGAITGYLGSIFTSQLSSGLAVLNLLSGLMLLVLALYIGQWWTGLRHLEQLGSFLWRYLRPLSKGLLPFRSPMGALPYGMVWGWLPCGLVYSTLSWSLASGSALKGATTMLFFGLGTLPALLALGSSGTLLRTTLSKSSSRKIVASVLLIFALILIYRAIINWR
jgi:sulfite exporter TauE/SafE